MHRPLIINVVVVAAERRFLGGLSNVQKDHRVAGNGFKYVMQELTEPVAFANGSGAAQVVAGKHLDLLRSQLNVRPRRVFDHMKLLAAVNRRVAREESTVSPFCHVVFSPVGPSTDRSSPSSHTFLENGESVPFEMPMIVLGIDLSGFMRRFHEDAQRFFREGTQPSSDYDADEMNRETRRRP
jgi:hypothetical protein